MATELAKAYVQIIPSAKGITGKLEKALGGEVDSVGEKTGSRLGNAIGGGLATVAKVGAAAVAAATTAVSGLVAASVNAYASYEQLTGGVQTLFGEISTTGDASALVMENAANAYKTAGLSANEYMESVTSFSASLMASLGNDGKAAAEAADMAVRDMSDNANKMGTSMESIQNAYQGFAKQNYTMLDNLKLGYGGTKKEMERLLEDAEKITGVKYDIENLNDVYSAIHVIQGELGITGTTAKEASTTIEGSLNSMKAAWQNVLTGIADENADFEGQIDALVESASAFAGNIMPRIEQALTGVGKLIEKLAPVIAETLPKLISDVLPKLLESGAQIVKTLADAIITNLPMLIETGLNIILELAQSLTDSLPTLIPTIVDVMLTIVETLVDNIDLLIDAAIRLMTALTEGLINALPIIIDRAPEIIEKLVTALINNAPKLMEASIKFVEVLAQAIVDNFPKLLSKIPGLVVDLVTAYLKVKDKLVQVGTEFVFKIISSISDKWTTLLNRVSGWVSNLVSTFIGLASNFLDIGKNYVDNIINSISNAWNTLIGNVAGWIQNLINAFTGGDWSSIGSNIVEGIKSGITNGWGALTNLVSQKAQSLLTTAKKSLGIKSPSRLFANEVGKYIPEGVAMGIEQAADVMNKAIDNALTGTIPEAVTVTNRVLTEQQGNYASGATTQTTKEKASGITQVFNFGREVASPAEMAREARLEAQYGLMRGIALG